MKSILVATDLSARSDRAFDRAARIALNHGARLTVVHVVDDTIPDRAADAQAAAARETIAEQIANLDPAPECTVRIVTGRDFERIIEESERSKCDIIVLGLHREEGLLDLFRGTTVERVIRLGRRPVLLAKNRPTRTYRRILVAVDFSAHARLAVHRVAALAPDAEIWMIHTFEVPFAGFITGARDRREFTKRERKAFDDMVEQEVASFMRGSVVDIPPERRLLRHDSVLHGIVDAVADVKPDLLALGTHGRSGVARAMLGSVAETLLASPPCDTLVVRAW